jgi:hypothetical protein
MGQKSSILIARAAALSLLIASSAFVPPATAQQSFTDKLKGLFGGGSKPQEQQQAPPVDPTAPQVMNDCPQVTIRAGASTYAVAAPGKQPIGNDVRFEATITKLARDCTRLGGDITARIGIQGRVIVGPSGAPPSVEVPLRIAVVQGGVGEKVIATKAYRTTVNVGEEDSVPFSFVADDMVYPAPSGAAADNYIFYVGFDPQLLSASERPKPVRRKK